MNWPVAPVLIPMLTALAGLFWGRCSAARRIFYTISATGQLAVAVYLMTVTYQDQMLVLPLGNWPARYGIVLVIDLLAAVMLALSTLIALSAILYGFAESSLRIEHPLRLPLIQFLVMGINLSFCTGDLFNLFVAFEILLISSYALLTLEANDWDVKQAYPYVAINLVGSTLFICAAGLTYGLFGTLNFAEIALRSAGMGNDPRILALGLLLMLVFGIKAGLFPLYFWLPNSYPTLPAPLAAFFSGMLTKVGVYVLLRVFGTVLPHNLEFIHGLLAWMAGVTMVLAVIGAISRNFIRGILAYHILSQIGFMVLAIGFFTPLSFAASIFYIVHHIIVKASLFLIGGVAARLNRTDDLDRMGHLWKHTPWLGVLFLFQALSLAGLPPLSGFWGKYLIVLEGLKQGEHVLVGASILASILTLFSMLKIWNAAFWSAPPDVEARVQDRRWVNMTIVIAGMTVISLAIGFGAEGFLKIAVKAADQALAQTTYANTVLSHLGKGITP
jgi:multicomponent Na+:H+ antiporter subunit D